MWVLGFRENDNRSPKKIQNVIKVQSEVDQKLPRLLVVSVGSFSLHRRRTVARGQQQAITAAIMDILSIIESNQQQPPNCPSSCCHPLLHSFFCRFPFSLHLDSKAFCSSCWIWETTRNDNPFSKRSFMRKLNNRLNRRDNISTTTTTRFRWKSTIVKIIQTKIHNSKMGGIFDFSSLVMNLLLLICACTYAREMRPTIFDGGSKVRACVSKKS